MDVTAVTGFCATNAKDEGSTAARRRVASMAWSAGRAQWVDRDVPVTYGSSSANTDHRPLTTDHRPPNTEHRCWIDGLQKRLVLRCEKIIDDMALELRINNKSATV